MDRDYGYQPPLGGKPFLLSSNGPDNKPGTLTSENIDEEVKKGGG